MSTYDNNLLAPEAQQLAMEPTSEVGIVKSIDTAAPPDNPKYRAGKWLRTRKYVPAVLILLLALLLVIFIGLWSRERSIVKSIPCLTDSCVKAGADFIRNIDKSLDPCDNFYEYACRGWKKNHPLPLGQPSWSVLRLLTKETDDYVSDIFHNSTPPYGGPAGRYAKNLYDSCINQSYINQRGLTPLYKFIEKHYGGWSQLPAGKPGARKDNLTAATFNLSQLIATTNIYSFANPLFRGQVKRNPENSSQMLIRLANGALTLEQEYYLSTKHAHFTNLTHTYIETSNNYAKYLGVDEHQEKVFDDIFDMEVKIAERMMNRSVKDPDSSSVVTNLSRIQQICPIIDWLWLTNELYASLNFTIEASQLIELTSEEHFRQRCALLAEVMKTDKGVRTLHNLFIWQILWSTPELLSDEVEDIFKKFKVAKEGLEDRSSRSVVCSKLVSRTFINTFGRVYVRDKFNERHREHASGMIEKVKASFRERLSTITWMLEDERQEAIRKVDSMKKSIGYPDYLFDTDIDEKFIKPIETIEPDTFFENYQQCRHAKLIESLYPLVNRSQSKWELGPILVNAFYSEEDNHIYFPAAIMSYPVFHPDLPTAMNYGAIGLIMGHEIVHAFDEAGSKYDSKSNRRQWWSNHTRNSFDNMTQCLINQYNNYSIYNTSLDGAQTLSENIADNGGLMAAYTAFTKLREEEGPDIKLPALQHTQEQLFFLSFAQLWCTHYVKQQVLRLIMFDTHTVDEYRVIGSLSNFPEFSKAFNCPLGSQMNPVKKCKVW